MMDASVADGGAHDARIQNSFGMCNHDWPGVVRAECELHPGICAPFITECGSCDITQPGGKRGARFGRDSCR